TADLRQRGSNLSILKGPSAAALRRAAAQTGATQIFCTAVYEPELKRRDAALAVELTAAGLRLVVLDGSLLFNPNEIQNQTGGAYRVFTPFYRRTAAALDRLSAPMAAPSSIRSPRTRPAGVELDALNLLPRHGWADGFARDWRPGEAGAAERLQAFAEERLSRYATDRDRPDPPGTSRLSAHLHFGELSPRRVVAVVRGAGVDGAGVQAYLRELLWREFAAHLLDHVPDTVQAPLDPRYADFPWLENAQALSAWQRGMTGMALVDAGMRELWTTGFMHNRLRMVVASFLTKNLGIDWRRGAEWFRYTLLDADLANNTLGWQWSAGCGADAAPYHRILSPVRQAERFDPERRYLRRWLPELACLPDEWLHCPWAAPAEVLKAANVRLGVDYPWPIVDLKASRERALAAGRLIATRRTRPDPRSAILPNP
ncbi:MAG TPA: deoxyribodipyrimidine photo-lyase, partial [Candidatus Dormibacteraeota bacterium]|nr:deoxyribodipyrimidine photo-lyase [Candidatus Dormibacteraeota bacterium]